MRTFNIEWRIISHPPRRIRTTRQAFIARREARARLIIRHDAMGKHARKARDFAGQFAGNDQMARAAYSYWTKMVIRHREAARIQRSRIAEEQAERERYHG